MCDKAASKPVHPTDDFRGSRVLIVGLGHFGGGVAAARWFAAQNASLTITDLAEAQTLSNSLTQIADLDADLRLGGHDGIDPRDFDLAVINPAVVKLHSDLFRAIQEAGTPWTTEMNLFCQRCPAKVVGVTGSYGKSTTCAMLKAIMDAAILENLVPHRAVHLGGNIGRSLLGELDQIHPTDLVILEMSNAQLEDLPRINWTPHVAAITNLWPHHLDRYESKRDYFSAKLNIARTQNAPTPLIVGDLHPRANAMLCEVIANAPTRCRRVAAPDPPLHLAIPGTHNMSNAATAITIGKHLGIDETLARKTLRMFRGLPDRLEHVRTIDGVAFINDSKSTSPTATTAAIQAILETPAHAAASLIVIVGGKEKDTDFDECAMQLAKAATNVICTGESGVRFAEAIRNAQKGESWRDRVQVVCVETLLEAIASARGAARNGDTVLFSPAAPSFDAYVNYAARGQHFRALVSEL